MGAVMEGQVSAMLRRKRDLLGAGLWAASRRLWSHADAARMYPALLFRSHCNARAIVSVLEAAAARLEPLTGEDPAAAGLLEFALGFIPEETGHDEWILEDLEALGLPRRDVLARVPPPAIAALVGAQLYWIAHHHPVSVLGYCYIAETLSPPIDKVEDLIRRTGLPRSAFRTLLRHASLDLVHGAHVEHVLDTLPLTKEHLSMIGVSMAHSLQSFATSTDEIVDLYELRSGAPTDGAEPAGCLW